jgi:hypothetical protein
MNRQLTKIKTAGKKTEVTFIDKDGRPNTIVGVERPHPDLAKAMDELKIPVAIILGYDYNRQLSKVQVVPEDETKTAINKLYLIRIDQIEIKGAKITGADDDAKKGVQITYILRQPDGRPTPAMNTARIPLNGDIGIEDQLENWCELIEAEAFAYIDGEKRAQLEMFDNSDPDEDLDSHEDNPSDED